MKQIDVNLKPVKEQDEEHDPFVKLLHTVVEKRFLTGVMEENQRFITACVNNLLEEYGIFIRDDMLCISLTQAYDFLTKAVFGRLIAKDSMRRYITATSSYIGTRTISLRNRPLHCHVFDIKEELEGINGTTTGTTTQLNTAVKEEESDTE